MWLPIFRKFSPIVLETKWSQLFLMEFLLIDNFNCTIKKLCFIIRKDTYINESMERNARTSYIYVFTPCLGSVAHVDQTIVSICYQYCLYRCFSVLWCPCTFSANLHWKLSMFSIYINPFSFLNVLSVGIIERYEGGVI